MKYTISLKKSYEFTKLYKKGTYYVGKYMVVYAMRKRKEGNRLGVALGKKYGNSVKRNRVKRLIRENYRAYEESIKKGFDIVILARTIVGIPEFTDIKKEMKYLIKKLELFEQEKNDCLKNH